MKKLPLVLLAALLVCGAASVRAADVKAKVLLSNGEQQVGTIRWLPADKKYMFGVKQPNGTVAERGYPADAVLKLQVETPPEWAKLRAQAQQSPDAALSGLQQLAERYRRLQWDGEAGALIAQIYLKKNNAKGAVDACRKIIQGNDRAAWDSAMAPWYWRALIESNQTGALPGLLEKGAQSADRAVAAQACLKRGDMFDAQNDAKAALKDGYLRVVFLFQEAGEVRAEAIYKAAQMFDKLHQAAYAEKMRKLLLDQYRASPWTKKLSSGD